MVFQKPTPFPMTIYENIAFGVKLHEKLSKSQMDERVEWSLTRGALWTEAKDRLHTSAMGLSGGQQQRLCIARTIAVRPEVILLDEPTSALDPISTLKIEELIDELKHDFTIAIVTHNMQQAARCADQVAFFYLGEMVEVAPAHQLVHGAEGKPHAGLRHRPVRLIQEGTTMSGTAGTPRQKLRSGSEAADRHADPHGRDRREPGRARRRGDHGAQRRSRDHARSKKTSKVDALEREVEQFVIRMLALRQPMAADLRLVVAALKITGDLERIGDYAANVAKRSIVLAQFPAPYSLAGSRTWRSLVQSQLKIDHRRAGRRDSDKAIEVWRSDRAVDDIYNTIFRELITYMMEDPRNITPCTHLLFIAKNLERIGDHTTNIAETIYYTVKGEVLPDVRPKGDTSAYAVVRPKENDKGTDNMPDGLSSLPQPLVLVVEDEAAIATMLRYNLEKQGYRVAEASDGQEALTRIQEQQPDIVLLDWMLPVMSGIEVCRQIRRKPATRDLPVIMVTARTEDQDAVRGLNTGADDYITKPFNIDALLARMRALLRRSNAVPDKGNLRFTISKWICHRTGSAAMAAECIWVRPSSGCWSSSCSIRGGCSPARNCWTRSGAMIFMSSPGRSMCISGGCGSR